MNVVESRRSFHSGRGSITVKRIDTRKYEHEAELGLYTKILSQALQKTPYAQYIPLDLPVSERLPYLQNGICIAYFINCIPRAKINLSSLCYKQQMSPFKMGENWDALIKAVKDSGIKVSKRQPDA